MKPIFAQLFLALLLLPCLVQAEKFIFVVNTTEEDEMGPATAAYMDEARWIRDWEPSAFAPAEPLRENKVHIVIIRANSNAELTRALKMWMTPLPTDEGPREVKGLGIYSHGLPMMLLNESEKFKVRLPDDIAKVFAPIFGRFTADARVVMMGCLVLDGQSVHTARQSLIDIAESFGLKRGLIYANVTKGIDPHTLFADPLNSDIKPMKRAAAMLTYLMWPLTSLIVPAVSRYYYNQGFALLRDSEDRLVPTRFEPALSAAFP